MKNLKKFNEANEVDKVDFAINKLVHSNVIAGWSNAIVIFMDEKTSTFKKELDTMASKYGWTVMYKDNAAVLMAEDEQDSKNINKIRNELGLR